MVFCIKKSGGENGRWRPVLFLFGAILRERMFLYSVFRFFTFRSYIELFGFENLVPICGPFIFYLDVCLFVTFF